MTDLRPSTTSRSSAWLFQTPSLWKPSWTEHFKSLYHPCKANQKSMDEHQTHRWGLQDLCGDPTVCLWVMDTRGSSRQETPFLPYTPSPVHTVHLLEDEVPNRDVLAHVNIPSMYTLLKQRRLRWLGHVCCMEAGRIPKDLLYGELTSGKRPSANETWKPHTLTQAHGRPQQVTDIWRLKN